MDGVDRRGSGRVDPAAPAARIGTETAGDPRSTVDPLGPVDPLGSVGSVEPVGRDDVVARVVRAVNDGPGVLVAGPLGRGCRTVVASAARRLRADGREVMVLGPSTPDAAAFAALGPFLGSSRPSAIDAAGLRWAADVVADPNHSGDVPVLVVGEAADLDDASRAVVHQLVVGERASVLGTCRPGPPGSSASTWGWWRGLVEQIDLLPLDRSAADRLAERLIGGPVEAAGREALWRLTRGHPGRLVAAVAAARDAGLWDRSGSLWALAGDLDRTVDRQILDEAEDLSPAARAVLECLALLDALPIDDAEALEGSGPLAATERLGLVGAEDVDGVLWCAVVDPLLAAAVRASIDPEVARRRWGRIADVMADTDRRRAPTPPSTQTQLTHGLAVLGSGRIDAATAPTATREPAPERDGRDDAAGDVRAPGSADLEVVVRGAEAAARLSRWGDCADLAERAWRASGRADVLQILTGALGMLGDHTRIGALTRDLERLDLDAVARASHTETIALSQYHLGRAEDAFATLAAARLDAPDHAGRIDLLESQLRAFAGDADGSRALAAAWIDDPDPERTLDAQVLVASDHLNRGRVADAIDGFDACIELALTFPDPAPHLGVPYLFRLSALAEGGRIEAAISEAETVEQTVVAGGDPTAYGWLALHLGLCHLRIGRPRTAVRWFDEAMNAMRRVQRPGWLSYPAAGLVAAHVAAGDVDAANEAMAYWREIPPNPVRIFGPDQRRLTATLAAAEGHADQATAEMRRAADEARAFDLPLVEAAALHDLSRYGDADDRRESADRLEVAAADADSELVRTHAARARALVDGDVAVLVAAADTYERSGFIRDAAESWAVAARVGLDDRDAAFARQRVAALLERCEVVDQPLLDGGEARARLTRREAEIVELVAAGASRQDVADRLVVSVRTVDSHLQRIYRKLGVRGRDELVEISARSSAAASSVPGARADRSAPVARIGSDPVRDRGGRRRSADVPGTVAPPP